MDEEDEKESVNVPDNIEEDKDAYIKVAVTDSDCDEGADVDYNNEDRDDDYDNDFADDDDDDVISHTSEHHLHHFITATTITSQTLLESVQAHSDSITYISPLLTSTSLCEFCIRVPATILCPH